MSQFKYNTYNQSDFEWFGSQYNYNGYSAGYYKNNATKNAHPESRDWPTVMNEMFQSKGNSSWRVLPGFLLYITQF